MDLEWFFIGFFTCATLDRLSEKRWGLSIFYIIVILVNLLSALEVF
jgi:hypothetical protein